MTEVPDRVLELLSARLDGESTPAQDAELERALASDERLRAAVDAAHAAERELRVSFAPIELGPRLNPLRLLAIAAMLLLAVCAVWWFGLRGAPPPVDGRLAHMLFVNDPEPQVVCDTPEKFLAYTVENFGVPVAADFTGAATLVGWRGIREEYEDRGDGAIEPRLLLARTPGGEPVVVIFQSARAPRPELDQRVGLNAFRKRLGPLTAWEITPVEDPVVLPLLHREQ